MTRPYGIRKVVGAINADGDAYWPAAMRRTYFEQCDLRKFIQKTSDGIPISLAVEFGCGYGRMLPVLSEFADEVMGIERDAELAAIASSLRPTYDIRQVQSFEKVAHLIDDASAGLILTYTVLQHLADEECVSSAQSFARILDPQGLIVICEDIGNVSGPDYYQRTLDQYQDLFIGMKMVGHAPRCFEDGRIVGQHMAFRWP